MCSALNSGNLVTSICRFLHVLDIGRLSPTARVWSSCARKPGLWAHIDVIFRPNLTLEMLRRLVVRAGPSLRSIRISPCAVLRAADVVAVVASHFRAVIERSDLSEAAGIEVSVTKRRPTGSDEDDEVISQLANCPVTVRVNDGVLGVCPLQTSSDLGVLTCGRRRLLRRAKWLYGKDIMYGCDACLAYCHICDTWNRADRIGLCTSCDYHFCLVCCESTRAASDHGSTTCKACGAESAENIGWSCSGCSARRRRQLIQCDARHCHHDIDCREAYCVNCVPSLLKTCPVCCLRACRYDCFAKVHATRWKPSSSLGACLPTASGTR